MDSSDRIKVVLRHLQQPVMRDVSIKKYKYTVDNKFLSEEQRQFYEDNGFLVIRNLISSELLDECKQRFVDLCDGKVPHKNMILMKEKSLIGTSAKGEYLYYKVQDFIWDEVLEKYVTHPVMLDYVQCFTSPNFHVIQSMLINKPPDAGEETSQHVMHQDQYYFPFRPADRVVGTWTAMERSYIENGCLFVVPGTHKAALQPHGYVGDANMAYHGLQGFDKIPKTDLIMEKGDTVFFHPHLFHGSYPNRTKGFRKAISCHYVSSDCHFFDIRGTVTEQVGNELTNNYIKKFGKTLTYQDIWRSKKRLLRGYAGTLV